MSSLFSSFDALHARAMRAVAAISVLALLGAGCGGGPTADEQQAKKPVVLDMWGVVDDIDAYQPVISAYQKSHPNVQVTFKRLRLEDYEQKLLEGFADDRGPDVFLIHNDWVGKYLSKIAPMPKTVHVGQAVTTPSGLGSTTVWSMQDVPTMSVGSYRSQYADVVPQDFVRTIDDAKPGNPPNPQAHIVGVPVSVDTLALFYNKDLLNQAGILEPPTNWIDFQAQVEKLVKLNQDQKTFAQIAVALGTGNNISRATDILTVLMVQNGAVMADANGFPTFQSTPAGLQATRTEPPAYSAIAFYTDFANPNKATYTWNADQPDALSVFMEGKSAYYFGYAYDLPLIKAQAPKLNLGIAKLPQVSDTQQRNMANYWGWTVAKKSKNPDVAWDFLNFLAKPENSKRVLDVIKRPAARKSLLTTQLDDETIGVFASQVLTAISWYRGNDPLAVNAAFTQLMTDALNPQLDMSVAMRNALSRIEQTLQ